MKKIVLAFLIFSIAACTNKKPWTKDTIVNDCLREFNKRNEKDQKFTGMQIPLICDCMGEKLSVKYKSDAESSKDEEGVRKISMDCAMDAMSK